MRAYCLTRQAAVITHQPGLSILGDTMKWFEHQTNCHNQEDLSLLLEEYGAIGYGVFWLVMEIVASQMTVENPEPSCTYHWKKWQRLIGVYHKINLKTMLIYMQSPCNLLTISDQSQDNLVNITIPNLLNIKDSYHKKSGQCKETTLHSHTHNNTLQDNIPPTPRKRVEKVEPEPTPKNLYLELENEAWNVYPITQPKARSQRHLFREQWEKRMREEEPPEVILEGIRNFAAYQNGRDPTMIPGAQVFIGKQKKYLGWVQQEDLNISPALQRTNQAFDKLHKLMEEKSGN